ncbi:MAG: stage II sporulation protein M [Thermoflexales bacterium]|nr:stage II sporulation protein M [Thermoflexales bacterium]
MNPEAFIKGRVRDWNRLAELVPRAGKPGGLASSEAQEFATLYRAVSDDLAYAQREFGRHSMTRYLNALTASAAQTLYRSHEPVARSIARFYAETLPGLFVELRPYVIAAAILFFGSALLAFAMVYVRPDDGVSVLGYSLTIRIREGVQWWKQLNGINQVGSATIMTNNLRIALMSFAGGMTGGFYTVYLALLNGFHLGAIFGYSAAVANPWPLAEFVVGHGVLELNEIVFATACGLALGRTLLQPGLSSRAVALGRMGRTAVLFMVGTAPTLVVAGLIEGFVSPSDVVPPVIKVALGVGTGVALYAYLLVFARRRTRR